MTALAQGSRVSTCVVESTGALTGHTQRLVGYLARRSRAKGSRDGTRYGSTRMSATSFYVHHAQRLSVRGALGDVRGIHESIRALKQRVASSHAEAA